MKAAPPDSRGMRRPLSSLPLPSRKRGEPKLASALFDALGRASTEEADTLTHGFHSYPARLHPAIASTVIDALAAGSGGTSSSSSSPPPSSSSSSKAPATRPHVVDPFCGSGTVLIEARRRGFYSSGLDINPVALRVARVKTDVRSVEARTKFLAILDEVVEQSKERVRARAQSHAPLSKEQVQRFEGHVLRELGGLYEEIQAVPEERDRKALEVVLSAIIVKVSKQRADTDEREAEGRRIGRFIPSEIFHKKGRELVDRWAVFAEACVASSPEPRLFLEDARELPRVLTKRASMIVTSPPYAGTYDYAKHHELRAPWLGVTELLAEAERKEIGARRSLTGGNARARWDAEVTATLRAIGEALDEKGTAVLVVGDGEIGGTRVAADEHIESLAQQAKLVVAASASAPRPDWRGGADRHEHLVALRRAR